MSETNWYVYIVRCNDDTLHTGITTDLKRRIAEHNSDRSVQNIQDLADLFSWFTLKNLNQDRRL